MPKALQSASVEQVVVLGTPLQTHRPLRQVWPEAQQTEPQTFALGQHLPFRHLLSEQHSISPLQVASPLGIQLTQVPLDSSQIPEQHWASFVQEPLFAIQQVPLLHAWPLEQQVLPHTWPLGQHDPEIQVVIPVHAGPLPQTQV